MVDVPSITSLLVLLRAAFNVLTLSSYDRILFLRSLNVFLPLESPELFSRTVLVRLEAMTLSCESFFCFCSMLARILC